MSELIAYDADGLVAAAERAQKLKNSVENTQAQLESLYGQLVSATSSMTTVPGGVSSSSVATLVSKKKLQVQAAKLESLVSVLNEAAGLTDTATKKVEERLDLFGLIVNAFQSGMSALKFTPAVAAGMAVADAFGELMYDVCSAGIRTMENIFNQEITPEQITANITSRDAAIMEIFESDKSNYIGKDRTFVNSKGQVQISCVYFTWRKIQQILGSDCTKNVYSSSKMRSLNGKQLQRMMARNI